MKKVVYVSIVYLATCYLQVAVPFSPLIIFATLSVNEIPITTHPNAIQTYAAYVSHVFRFVRLT